MGPWSLKFAAAVALHTTSWGRAQDDAPGGRDCTYPDGLVDDPNGLVDGFGDTCDDFFFELDGSFEEKCSATVPLFSSTFREQCPRTCYADCAPPPPPGRTPPPPGWCPDYCPRQTPICTPATNGCLALPAPPDDGTVSGVHCNTDEAAFNFVSG